MLFILIKSGMTVIIDWGKNDKLTNGNDTTTTTTTTTTTLKLKHRHKKAYLNTATTTTTSTHTHTHSLDRNCTGTTHNPIFIPPPEKAALIKNFAIPQVTLAVLALISYHVQIINRLSSGYVVWYWWLAQLITAESQEEVAEEGEKEDEENDDEREKLERKKGERKQKRKVGWWIVRWMVVYGLVQAVVFAGFLPPA